MLYAFSFIGAKTRVEIYAVPYHRHKVPATYRGIGHRHLVIKNLPVKYRQICIAYIAYVQILFCHHVLQTSIMIGRIIGRRRVRSKIKRPRASRMAHFSAAHSVIPSSSQWQRASSTRIFTSSMSSSDSRT